MNRTRTLARYMSILLITPVILSACGSSAPNTPAPASPEAATVVSTEQPSDASTTSSTQELSTKNNSLIKHHYTEHEYNHGSEGYYNLADDVDFELTAQLSGTCWICASANAMMTAYQLDHDDVHADLAGYHVFNLDEPVDVDEYAVAITYPEGVPVEGQDFELDTALYTHFTSKPGESFIQVGDEWLDLSDEATWKQLGCETNNACIRALYKD